MAWLKEQKGKTGVTRHVGYRNPENGKEDYYPLPRGLTRHEIKAKIKEIEHRIAKYKNEGSQGPFHIDGQERVDHLTISELTDKVCTHETRVRELSKGWIERNRFSMGLLMKVVGKHLPMSRLQTAGKDHIDQFKAALYDDRSQRYESTDHETHDKVCYGVNRELSSIRSVMRFAVEKGIMPASYLPKIEMMPVHKRLPEILDHEEIIAMANKIENPHARMAFWICIYTGARRVEIVQKRLGDNRGLKWRHINWFNNSVNLFSKGKERLVPLHKDLRRRLLDRKAELGDGFNREDHVIDLTADTISHYFQRAKIAAGVDKSGSVHILRHTAATILLKLAGGNLRLVQEWLGHESLETTQIYTHVDLGDMQKVFKTWEGFG